MNGERARAAVLSSALVLSPDHRRAFTTTVTSTVGVVVPPYLTAFLARLPSGAQPLLLLPIVLLPAVAALVWLRVRRVVVELGSDGLAERRVLPPDRFFPRDEIASVVVLRLITARAITAPRQLFVRDGDGRTLFRMREASWGSEQFDALLGRISVPAQIIAEPQTITDLRQSHLVDLTWWERSPALRGLVLTTSLIAGAAALLLPLFAH